MICPDQDTGLGAVVTKRGESLITGETYRFQVRACIVASETGIPGEGAGIECPEL